MMNLVHHQALLLAVVCILVAEGQNNRRQNRRQNRRPNQRQNNRNRGQFGRNGVTRNGARDARGTEVYPGCSGKVCLPEAQLCAERKQKVSNKVASCKKARLISWGSKKRVAVIPPNRRVDPPLFTLNQQ